ncbi:MAG: hypothetical protein HYS23_01370 [Geobacter sp.]|nr:hypothetical protein [Geobacter sp.]
MLELIRERLKGYFVTNTGEESGMKSNNGPGFKIKNRLARMLAFLAPETEKLATLSTVDTWYDQLIAKYDEIFETQARTIKTLEDCIEIQSETIACLKRTNETQDETICLLNKLDSLNEMMIVQLIDRLEMASQKYDDPKLIYEELLALREELIGKGDVGIVDQVELTTLP